jgi:putative glycosyltransferase (TIGR04348 family)
MRIGIITPAPPRSKYGNRITALRWARILQDLGHRVSIALTYAGEPYDLLVALHARRSYLAIRHFHDEHPGRPLVVALTGTDLYRDLARSRRAQKSLELATRLVALQPKASDELGSGLRSKLRIIYQSATSVLRKSDRGYTAGVPRGFVVCVIGHLRPVKDPFRTALAARRLPSSSQLRILHVGAAMSKEMMARAQAEMTVNPRYRWLGEQPRWRVAQILGRSALCVLSSRLEGGANVISEAVVAGVPLVASRIPGSVGLLGQNYAGYFAVGDTAQLATLLGLCETDPVFLAKLRSHCRELAPLFDPRCEQAAWHGLLNELASLAP